MPFVTCKNCTNPIQLNKSELGSKRKIFLTPDEPTPLTCPACRKVNEYAQSDVRDIKVEFTETVHRGSLPHS